MQSHKSAPISAPTPTIPTPIPAPITSSNKKHKAEAELESKNPAKLMATEEVPEKKEPFLLLSTLAEQRVKFDAFLRVTVISIILITLNPNNNNTSKKLPPFSMYISDGSATVRLNIWDFAEKYVNESFTVGETIIIRGSFIVKQMYANHYNNTPYSIHQKELSLQSQPLAHFEHLKDVSLGCFPAANFCDMDCINGGEMDVLIKIHVQELAKKYANGRYQYAVHGVDSLGTKVVVLTPESLKIESESYWLLTKANVGSDVCFEDELCIHANPSQHATLINSSCLDFPEVILHFKNLRTKFESITLIPMLPYKPNLITTTTTSQSSPTTTTTVTSKYFSTGDNQKDFQAVLAEMHNTLQTLDVQFNTIKGLFEKFFLH